MVMGGASIWTLVIALAIFICTMLIIRRWRGHQTMKDLAIETVCGVLATALVGIIVFLIHIIFISPPKIYIEAVIKNATMYPTKQSTSKKSLPAKIISTNEFTPTPIDAIEPATNVLFAPSSNVEPKNQFENFNATTNTEPNYATLLEQKKSEKADKRRQHQLNAQAWWDQSLKIYQYALITLRDTLKEKADKMGDGISQSRMCFDCLPQQINMDVGELNDSEIRFQKNTNMSFKVIIGSLSEIEKRRHLVITCDGGSLDLLAPDEGDVLYATLHCNPDLDIEENTNASPEIMQKLVYKTVNELIAIQTQHLKSSQK